MLGLLSIVIVGGIMKFSEFNYLMIRLLFASIILSVLLPAHTLAEEINQNSYVKEALLDYKNGNYSEAYSKFNSLALDGNIDAKFYLGVMLNEGTSGEIDNVKALQLFKEVSENSNNIAAYSEYGVLLSNIGDDENDIQSKYWLQGVEENIALLEQQASEGNPFYELALGVMYNYIENIKDPIKSYYWINKAAEINHPQGLYHLAIMYEDGIDDVITQDLEKAFDLYTKAHEEGLVWATEELAWLQYRQKRPPKRALR
jgi:TPR repeat protein